MTKDDFYFSVSNLFEKCKTKEEIVSNLKSMVVSGYNVGDVLENRILDVYSIISGVNSETNFSEKLYSDLVPNFSYDLISNPDTEMSIDRVLLDLKNTSSSLDKEKKLISWFDSESEHTQLVFLKLVNLTLSSVYTYNCTIKAFSDIDENYIPNDKELPHSNSLAGFKYNIDYLLLSLEALGLDDEMKPKEKIHQIRLLLIGASITSRRLLRLALDRSLDIKMNEKTFYNILGYTGKVSIIPYQRCETEDKVERLTFPCMVQLKADGKFQNLIFSPNLGQGVSLNRSGKKSMLKPFSLINQFNNETGYLKKVWNIAFNIMGEALVKLPGETISGKSALDIKVYERETSNGLLNSYGKRSITFPRLFNDVINNIGNKKILKNLEKLISQLLEWQYVEDNVIYQVWNMVPYENWKNLDTKFTCNQSYIYINDFINNYNAWLQTKGIDTNFIVIHNEYHESIDTIYDLFDKVLGLGLEGLVGKNLNANIEHGTSNQGIIKFKDFKECDLRVIGYEPGTGQFLGGIGSLICSTECSGMIVNVAGLKNHHRGFVRVDPNNSSAGLMIHPEHTNDKFNGKIITAKYNKLSMSKKGVASLSLPSVVEERTDVTRANFLNEIKK